MQHLAPYFFSFFLLELFFQPYKFQWISSTVLFQWYSSFPEDHFKDCHPNVSGFDECIREALNAIRPYFKTGLSQYKVDSIDPFFAKEVSVSRGMPNLGFTLTLKNVTETGWVRSKVTKFVSDFTNYRVST